MSLYFPTSQPAVAPNILMHKVRCLPVPGDILAHAGALVEADDVVARATMPGVHAPVPVAGPLGVAHDTGARYLSKPIGAAVEAGEVLAARRGFGRRTVVRSPATGTLSGYDGATGAAIITLPGATFELPAHLGGVVTEHIPNRGLVIETPAALVRGIAGVGGEQHGMLHVAVADPAEELEPDQITARFAHGIVLGGGTISAAALERAVEQHVRAVIAGSILEAELRAFLGYAGGLRAWTFGRAGWAFPPPPDDAPAAVPADGGSPGRPGLPPAWPPPLTLIIVEGFGCVPMAAPAWALLAAHDGEPVAVDGTTRLRGGLIRPEIIVPLAGARGTLPSDTPAPPLAARSVVRLLAPPYLGQVARVLAVAAGKQRIDSGLCVPAAHVQLPDGHETWVPMTNLEVLE